MSTLVSGAAARRSGIASIPLRPGMTMSSSSTSGRVAATRSIASSAFAASPTTSIPSSASSSRRRPDRSSAWSSQISTRIAGMTEASRGTAPAAPQFVRRDAAGFYESGACGTITTGHAA